MIDACAVGSLASHAYHYCLEIGLCLSIVYKGRNQEAFSQTSVARVVSFLDLLILKYLDIVKGVGTWLPGK